MMLKETVSNCENSWEMHFMNICHKKIIHKPKYTNNLKIKPGFITEYVQMGKFIFGFFSLFFFLVFFFQSLSSSSC